MSKKSKLNIAVCVLVKNEERYIDEFIKHYIGLGFSKVIICDNNDNETFDFFTNYIENGEVIYENYCGHLSPQLKCYNEIYAKYKNDFDWIAFFDCDEFLTLTNHKKISSFLRQPKFSDCNVIMVNWRMHGDNNLLYYDERGVQERFPDYAPKDLGANTHVKVIVRCVDDFIKMITPHCCYFVNSDTVSVNCNGDIVPYNSSRQSVVWEGAVLEHYYTKTISEFIERRFDKTCADVPNRSVDEFLKNFFELCEHTDEKDNIIRDFVVKCFNGGAKSNDVEEKPVTINMKLKSITIKPKLLNVTELKKAKINEQQKRLRIKKKRLRFYK